MRICCLNCTLASTLSAIRAPLGGARARPNSTVWNVNNRQPCQIKDVAALSPALSNLKDNYEGPCVGLHSLREEIHVHWLDTSQVSDTKLSQEYAGLLPASDVAYVKEARHSSVRKERFLSRVLLRTTLCHYLDSDLQSKDLQFSTNLHGKPKLELGYREVEPIYFNLTHKASLIGVAVGLGVEVGLDVELASRSPKANVLRLAHRWLHPKEAVDLEGIRDEKERWSRFVLLWTVKEAFVKAKGVGFSGAAGFKGFHVDLQNDPRVTRPLTKMTQMTVLEPPFHMLIGEEVDAQDCLFVLFKPSPRHVATLCVRSTTAAAADRVRKICMYRTIPLTSSARRNMIIMGGGPFTFSDDENSVP